jgi:hypothetical protein
MHEKIGSWSLVMTKSHDQEECVRGQSRLGYPKKLSLLKFYLIQVC